MCKEQNPQNRIDQALKTGLPLTRKITYNEIIKNDEDINKSQN